jgi:DNA-binding transcriptional LysR family regulator
MIPSTSRHAPAPRYQQTSDRSYAPAASDIVAAVPLALARMAARLGLKIGYRDLPVETAAVAIAQAWHPRFENDAGHRWLRQAVRKALSGSAQPRQ